MAYKSFVSKARLDDFNNIIFDCIFETTKGEVITKSLSYDDYKLVVLESGKEKTAYVPVRKLPEGYISGALSTDEKTWKGLFFVPGAKRQFVSDNFNMIAQIPYPSLVFAVSYSEGRPWMKEVYAVKAKSIDEIGEDTKLYRYPYGNVSREGSICMGNISVPDLKITEIGQFISAFFEGVDEGHYYTPGVMVKPKYSLGTLVSKAVQKDVFPENWLVGNGGTIGALEHKMGIVG